VRQEQAQLSAGAQQDRQNLELVCSNRSGPDMSAFAHAQSAHDTLPAWNTGHIAQFVHLGRKVELKQVLLERLFQTKTQPRTSVPHQF
jgi:hypothetical protein